MEQRSAPPIAADAAVHALVVRDARDPQLADDEHVILDFEAVPEQGDYVLVLRGGRFRVERVETRALLIGADWVIAVLRYVGVGVVLAAVALHAAGCAVLVD